MHGSKYKNKEPFTYLTSRYLWPELIRSLDAWTSTVTTSAPKLQNTRRRRRNKTRETSIFSNLKKKCMDQSTKTKSPFYLPNIQIFVTRIDRILSCMNINGDNFCSRATKCKKKNKKQSTREHSPGKTHIKFRSQIYSSENFICVVSKRNEIDLSKEPMNNIRNGVYIAWIFTF